MKYNHNIRLILFEYDKKSMIHTFQSVIHTQV